MFTITVKTSFYASHQLTLPDGSKEQLHYHDWQVIVDVSTEQLNDMGLVMDFGQLKAAVDGIIAEFGKAPLEKIDYFRQNSSSAETVAKYIYARLQRKIPKNLKLEAIRVVEEPGCSAKFSQ